MQRKTIGAMAILMALLTCVSCARGSGAISLQPTQPPSSGPAATSPSQEQPTAPPTEAPSPTPEPPLAARVNGQPIYLADYDLALAQYEMDLRAKGVDPESDEGRQDLNYARTWILNVMIEQVLTELEAAKVGIVVTEEEVDAYIAGMVAEYGGQEAFEARLAEMGDTLETAWQKSRSGLIGLAMMKQITAGVPPVTEHVHARHMLVDTEREAQSLLGQLRAGADFATLAQAYSQDASTKETGGDLGFFPRGILVAPEVEDVAFSLEPGQISEVITSALGFHILQVIEVDPEREVSPENQRLLQDMAVQKWIEELWADAEIEVFVEGAS